MKSLSRAYPFWPFYLRFGSRLQFEPTRLSPPVTPGCMSGRAVEGVVTAVSTSRKGNTFINFGGVYPNQCFTGWISTGPDRDASLESLKGKKIKITGTVQLYQGKPEIKIQSRSQIVEE